MIFRYILALCTMALLAACSSTEVLKQPCSDPGIHAYVDDCGPLLPVNDAFDEVMVDP